MRVGILQEGHAVARRVGASRELLGVRTPFSCRGLVMLVEMIVQAPQASWFASNGLRALWIPDSPTLLDSQQAPQRQGRPSVLGISSPPSSS